MYICMETAIHELRSRSLCTARAQGCKLRCTTLWATSVPSTSTCSIISYASTLRVARPRWSTYFEDMLADPVTSSVGTKAVGITSVSS
jgi:hypothetical protein